jgi:hypothetical protein
MSTRDERKAKAANEWNEQAETRELVAALRALATECVQAASDSALVAQTAYWERNAHQLRFIAVLAQEGRSSPYLPLAADWVTAGRRLLDGHRLAVAAMPPMVPLLVTADRIATDGVHESRSTRR